MHKLRLRLIAFTGILCTAGLAAASAPSELGTISASRTEPNVTRASMYFTPTSTVTFSQGLVTLSRTAAVGKNGIQFSLRMAQLSLSQTPYNGGARLVVNVRDLRTGACRTYVSPPIPFNNGRATANLSGKDLGIPERVDYRFALCGHTLVVADSFAFVLSAGVRRDRSARTRAGFLVADGVQATRGQWTLDKDTSTNGGFTTQIQITGLKRDGVLFTGEATFRIGLAVDDGPCTTLESPFDVAAGRAAFRRNGVHFGTAVTDRAALCDPPRVVVNDETLLYPGILRGPDRDGPALSDPVESEPFDPTLPNVNGEWDQVSTNTRKTWIRSDAFGNTFVAGTPVSFHLVQTAGPTPLDGYHVVRVTDPYGTESIDEVVYFEIFAGTAWKKSWTLTDPILGVHTVTVESYDLADNLIATTTETLGIVPPYSLEHDPSSRIGYFTYFVDWETPYFGEIANQMKALGIHHVRDTFRWSDLDASPVPPDKTDPSWLDTSDIEVRSAEFAAHGIASSVQFGSVARWASSQPHRTDPIPNREAQPIWAFSMPRADDDYQDWRDMVATLAARLPSVSTFELLNEPESYTFFEPLLQQDREQAGSLYRLLAGITREALDGVRPGLKITINPANRNVDFEDALFTPNHAGVGGLRFPDATEIFDKFGYHYATLASRFGDDSAVIVTNTAQNMMSRYGIDMTQKSYVNTEAFGTDEKMMRFWLNEVTDGTEVVYHFIYKLGRLAPDWNSFFGVHPVNPDYTLRHQAVALRTLSDEVGSADPQGSYAAGGVARGYKFKRGEDDVVALYTGSPVLWSPVANGNRTLRVASSEVTTLHVTDLMGNTTVHPVMNGRVTVPHHSQVLFLEAPTGLTGAAPVTLE